MSIDLEFRAIEPWQNARNLGHVLALLLLQLVDFFLHSHLQFVHPVLKDPLNCLHFFVHENATSLFQNLADESLHTLVEGLLLGRRLTTLVNNCLTQAILATVTRVGPLQACFAPET